MIYTLRSLAKTRNMHYLIILCLECRRKKDDKLFSKIELRAFNSIIGSIGFIGQTTSPIKTYFNSYMQQKRRGTKIHHLMKQNVLISQLKQVGTTCCYHDATYSGNFELYTLYFADAARQINVERLDILAGW